LRIGGIAPFTLEVRMKLNELFKWTGELTIRDKDGEPVIVRKRSLVLHQRIIGDSDLGLARKMALKASRELRKELKDETSNSFAAMIPDYEDIEDGVLANMVILASSPEIRRAAIDQADRPREPLEPDQDASLEVQEDYETELEEYKTAINEAIDTKVGELIQARSEELKELSRVELTKLFLESTVRSICQAEMLRTFNSWCSYLGTYRDRKYTTRAFASYAEFADAATELKSQILNGYLMLEIAGTDLKN